MSQAGDSDPLEPNYELLKSKMGSQMLLHSGHAYYMHRNNQNSSMWTCINRKKLKCRGSVKLSDENDLVSVKHQHTSQCEPDHRKLEVRKALRELCEAVGTTSDPIRRLYELKMAELREKGLGSMVPKFDSVNSMLYRARNRARDVKTDVTSRGEESTTENHVNSQECQGQDDLGQDSKSFSAVKLRHRSPVFIFRGSPGAGAKIDPEGENETLDAEPLSEPEPKPKAKKTKKKKKRRRRSDSSETQQRDEEPSESPGGSSDSDRLFLLSFLPEMQRLPPHIKMWARTRIANVMQEAVSYHYDNQPLPDTDIKHANVNTE
ncbi:uncharacterized protein LOC121728346 isoform X1 [Aricia agestis]|uniref:uncharacterized protein LOC121728346 isoform X1 n=1 Tax=Aricia agestis TaxID=91739 RepID=UPI001C201669|nr:uncharacterized protein LOC121728346 isoform X1 [Aricia agestis]